MGCENDKKSLVLQQKRMVDVKWEKLESHKERVIFCEYF